MNYKIKSNDKTYEVSKDIAKNLDLHPTKHGFHVLHQAKSYAVKTLHTEGKSISLEINGSVYNIEIADAKDQLVEKMGLSEVANTKMSSIKAPMPGLILEINVKAGDSVMEGDTLAILEAMKMENALKAAGEGIIKSVEVTKGDTVEKGQLLIEME